MKLRTGIGVLTIAGSALFATPVSALANAYHYDYDGMGVTKITVGLSNCNGGGLNLTSDWRNRIDAAFSIDCNARHYNSLNYGGFLQSIHGVSRIDLASGDQNRTESIKYT